MICVLGTLAWLPGFCYFVTILAIIALTIQLSCFGCYQLARLYYCFAKDQIYSNKGYPNWLFTIMYIIGAIILISFTAISLLPFPSIIQSECGINSKYEYYSKPAENSWFSGPKYEQIRFCGARQQ